MEFQRPATPDRRFSMFGALKRRDTSSTFGVKAECDTDTKGPLGLNLLHDVADPAVDFIFIHGFGGGSVKTWSTVTDRGNYWPKEWLPQEPGFERARIHSFGYKADWTERKDSVLNVRKFAQSLVNELHCNPGIHRSKTKVVLVAHSMGGIVAKKAYLLAREDANLADLGSRIHTIYFLATPHRGSELAKSLEYILQMSQCPKPFVTDLKRNSDSIVSVNDSFRHVAHDLHLWSFYETLKTNLIVKTAMIVEEDSAILGYPTERVLSLNADHRNVCKFGSKDDPNYTILRNAFIQTIDKISAPEPTFDSNLPFRLANVCDNDSILRSILGIQEFSTDDLSELDDVRVDGSCEWMTSSTVYNDWFNSKSNPILWVSGHPGCGKSVLCSMVIRVIKAHNADCSYYLFRRGTSSKSTLFECLKAMAYQMATVDESIRDRILELGRRALSSASTQWDAKALWRQIFVGCIFKTTNISTPRFWVIDALDECQQFQNIFGLLSQAPPYLKVFITSRGTPEIETGFTKLSNISSRFTIQPEDTIQDLATFVDSKMPYLPSADNNSREILKTKILAKSAGSFLWVSLVIEELESVYSEEAAEDVLSDVPTDLNDMYARLLAGIQKNSRTVVLAHSILLWAVLSFRPLTVAEIQSAVKRDSNHTAHNLERNIHAICGQLVYVNRQKQVSLIHQTAKSFLLQQEACEDLRIDKKQGHTRLAQICLQVLVESLRDVRSARLRAVSVDDMNLIEYSCEHFADHLKRSSSDDDAISHLLSKFLGTNILIWMERLARNKKLRVVTRTAKSILDYMQRRSKYVSPLSSEQSNLMAWAQDLMRIVAKFGHHLALSPSAICNWIPAICPLDSNICRAYNSRHTGALISGDRDVAWDDCLARIDFPDQRTDAIAHGELFSAVAVSNGIVFVYHQDCIQSAIQVDHGTKVSLLTFGDGDRYLASYGLRTVKVWNPSEGNLLCCFQTDHHILTMLFLDGSDVLMAATTGNYTISWDLKNTMEPEIWHWTGCIRRKSWAQSPQQQPMRAQFSPNSNHLAVSYRGLPVYLFSTESRTFLGCCGREGTNSKTSHYFADAMTFNPSPEINVLIVSFGDGELVVYDVASTELRYRCAGVFAHSLACSPDGRSLVMGSSNGRLQIFEFAGTEGETLVPLYRVEAHDDGIRGLAFSGDSLRFADIRGSQYRVWEPTILGLNCMDEGSQSGISHGNTLPLESIQLMEDPEVPEITAICTQTGSSVVFCGSQDGAVTAYCPEKSAEKRILYRHASDVAITALAFLDGSQLLMSADESGRVLLSRLETPTSSHPLPKSTLVADIRSEGVVTKLVPHTSGMKLLICGAKTVEMRTCNGEKIGDTISFGDDGSSGSEPISAFAHPLRSDKFLCLGETRLQIHSWCDGRLVKSHFIGSCNAPRSLTEPSCMPAPVLNCAAGQLSSQKLTDASTKPPYIAHLVRRGHSSRSGDITKVQVWQISDSSNFSFIPISGFLEFDQTVMQIIGVHDNRILFVDRDYWVCSAELESSTHTFRRHFFLLSEWQTGLRTFIIEYVPSRREFVIVKKSGLLFVHGGLDTEDKWPS